jgi:hypothetical protein
MPRLVPAISGDTQSRALGSLSNGTTNVSGDRNATGRL